MKDNLVRVHTLQELMAITDQFWDPTGLQIIDSPRAMAMKMNVVYPFKLDCFCIFLVTGTSLKINVNFHDYTLSKNDLFIVPPNTTHQFVADKQDCPFTGIAFTQDYVMQAGLPREHIESFHFLVSNSNPCISLSTTDADQLISTIMMMQKKSELIGSDRFGADILRHYFDAFMFELASVYHRYNPFRTTSGGRKEDLLMRFLKLLSDNVREERSLQYYADLLYVTPKYLTQSVKQVSGKTAGEFVDDMVIREAKQLLGDRSLSISQVADQLFFSDQFFFSKFFKRHTGKTPSEYRRSEGPSYLSERF